jgi:hypothetical protein
MNYFSDKTWVPVSLVGALVVVAVSTTSWLVNTINELEKQNNIRWTEMQKELEVQHIAIEKLSDAVSNSWTVALQSEFSLRFQNANPDLRIPDPRDLTKTLK